MIENNAVEHVFVNDANTESTAVRIQPTADSKKLARHDKNLNDLTTYVPAFDINNGGTLTFTHPMSEEGVENRVQLTKVVNKKRTAYMVAGLASFEVSLAGLIASGMTPEITLGLIPELMGFPILANLILGPIIAGVSFSVTPIPKKLSPIVNVFIPKIQTWLQEGYGLTVSDKTAQRIVFQMLLSDARTTEHIEFKTTDKKSYTIYKRDDEYVVLRPRNKRLWEVPYIGEQKVAPEITAVVEPAQGHNSTFSITPEVPEQQAFLDKIALLEKQNLTPEEQHIVDRAKQEAYAAHNAARVLKTLGSNEYAATLSEVFTFINTEVETIISRKQESMYAQLKMSKEILQERSRAPFMLT